jgi:hypothetical protein
MAVKSVAEACVDFRRPAAETIRKYGVKRVVAISSIGRGWKKEADSGGRNFNLETQWAPLGSSLTIAVS